MTSKLVKYIVYYIVLGFFTVVFNGLESFVDANESAIDRAGVHHILEIINDKWNPCEADTKKQEYHQSHHPDHGTILIVDLCGYLRKDKCRQKVWQGMIAMCRINIIKI